LYVRSYIGLQPPAAQQSPMSVITLDFTRGWPVECLELVFEFIRTQTYKLQPSQLNHHPALLQLAAVYFWAGNEPGCLGVEGLREHTLAKVNEWCGQRGTGSAETTLDFLNLIPALHTETRGDEMFMSPLKCQLTRELSALYTLPDAIHEKTQPVLKDALYRLCKEVPMFAVQFVLSLLVRISMAHAETARDRGTLYCTSCHKTASWEPQEHPAFDNHKVCAICIRSRVMQEFRELAK